MSDNKSVEINLPDMLATKKAINFLREQLGCTYSVMYSANTGDYLAERSQTFYLWGRVDLSRAELLYKVRCRDMDMSAPFYDREDSAKTYMILPSDAPELSEEKARQVTEGLRGLL